jgi:enoyl-[acyl-carrier protein] reductase II
VNRICEMLECTYPIIEGGLAYVGNGLLAAAVSEAGGFGQVGCGGRSPESFAKEVEIASAHTSRPFGVNIPISEHRDPSAYLSVVELHKDRIRAVSLSAGNPRPFIEPLHRLGLIVMTLASTPEQARKAEAAGADIVICEGTEAGGHNGPAELSTLVLLPLCASSVSIPVVAAGGIASGQAAAAALCLGAEGIQMGTRFVATKECEAHDAYKQALAQAHATDTLVIERSFGRVTRVMKTPFVNEILLQEKETPGDANKLLPMISGKKNAVAALSGQMNEGYVYCGMGVENITDVPSAGDVVRQIGLDMDRVLQQTADIVSNPFA